MSRRLRIRLCLVTVSLAMAFLLQIGSLETFAQSKSCTKQAINNDNNPCGQNATCVKPNCGGFFTDAPGGVSRCNGANPLLTSNCSADNDKPQVYCGDGGPCATNPDTGYCANGPATAKTATPCSDKGVCNTP